MKIVMVASEVVPYSKTGGLGDVIGALPVALDKLGEEVTVISPLYAMVRNSAREMGLELDDTGSRSVRVPVGDFDQEVRLVRGRLPDSGVTVYFLQNDRYYDRPGLYVNPADGSDYQDNSERFVCLCRGALEVCKAQGIAADVFHCHDWQTGLIATYVKHLYQADFPRAASVFTVHNLAYQGLFWQGDMGLTGLPWELFNWRMLEYYGNLSFLKAGLVSADAVSTVSKRYAKEIQTQEFGMGMHGVLQTREDALFGIVNGVDYGVWDPATDSRIAKNYSPDDLAGKAECKKAVQAEFNLPQQADAPLIGMIGRLVEQKGFDLVAMELDTLMERDVQLVVLGTGEERYHEMLRSMALRYPENIGVRLGFDEALAHRIEAGADMFLMPSRFEPCGLNQLYSLKYGTVPVVSATGGLVDTVVGYSKQTSGRGVATGFTFRPGSASVMIQAIDRALDMYRNKRDEWRALMLRGMKQDWSWGRSAQEYRSMYAKAVARRAGK